MARGRQAPRVPEIPLWFAGETRRQKIDEYTPIETHLSVVYPPAANFRARCAVCIVAPAGRTRLSADGVVRDSGRLRTGLTKRCRAKSCRNIWLACGSATNFALTRRLKGAGPRALCILGISHKFCSDPKIAYGQSPMGKFGNAFQPYREMTVEELFPLAAARSRAGRPAGAAPGLQLGEGAGGRFSHTSRYQRGAGCYTRARLRADPV